MEGVFKAKQGPDGGLVDRLSEIKREEDKAQLREAELEASAVELIAFAQRVREQARALKGEAARLVQAGLSPGVVAGVQERLGATSVPPLEVDAVAGAALKSREELLARRAEAAEALEAVLAEYRQTLQETAGQLAEEERRLGAMKERFGREREAAMARAQAAAEPVERADDLIVPSGPPKEVRLRAVVDFESDTNFFTGFANDIRQGGLFVATLFRLARGTKVEVEFSLPGGCELKATGIVTWRREGNYRDRDVFPGVGVQFLDLPERVAAEIAAFVAKREPLFFPA